MLITNPSELAPRLASLATTQVIVRYVQHGELYDASLAADIVTAFSNHQDTPYLVRLRVFLRWYAGRINGETHLDCDHGPLNSQMRKVCDDWNRENFDCWMHDASFMGTTVFYENGVMKTSVKSEPWSSRWRLLAGFILGDLNARLCSSEPEGASRKMTDVLLLRFSAFVAQNEQRLHEHQQNMW